MKNKKSHNLNYEKPLCSTELRKPCVFKKRSVGRSKNYGFICYSNRFNPLPENHNCMEFYSEKNKNKNYQNNCQLMSINEKPNDQHDKSVTVTPLNDNDNADQCSNSMPSTTQNKEQLYSSKNVKCHDIKTMIINRGTKHTTGT